MSREIISGWQGRYYEDFTPRHLYRSRFGHTVTEADNALFTQLTHNTNPLHFDAEFASRTRWGQILVNSTFTLALVVGMSVPDVSENAVANLGWEEVKLTHPVFIGDTLYCETEVLETRLSKSQPEAGIVKVRSRGVNQRGQVVLTMVRNVMVYKRDCAPESHFPEIQA
jgi:itaconyl-CoA hydratase